MAASYTHDLAIKTGEYTDQEGRQRGRYLNVGKIFKHDDGGTSIKLECIPLGLPNWEGWISVYPRRERNWDGGQGNQTGHAPQTPQRPSERVSAPSTPPPDDDIPF